jgi:hypothetical protein
MISVRDAVEKAVEFARGVLEGERVRDLRLEEVEISQAGGEQRWLVTLSMPKIRWFEYSPMSERQ